MKFTFDELKLARERGYSDDEIWNTLASEDEEIGLAKQRGYSLEEVASITSGQPIPEGFATQPAEPAPEATLAEGAEDIGRKFLMGGAGGIRAFTDLLGADNPVSQSIAGIEDYIAEGLSAESKQDSQAISRLFQEVESKGLTDKFLAGLEAFKMAPAETLAQTAGYMIPNLAAGLAGKAAQLTRGGMMALQAGVGAAQGMGTAKGEIYQGSYDYLINQGVPEDEARSKATEAQATFGENLPQIFLSAGLGAAAASTGAERIITRMLTRTGKEVSERSIKDVIKGGLKGIAGEVPIETLQEGQEKVATNIALQNLGADVDTFAGVPQAVGMAVGPAAILGGVAGAVEVLTPEQQAERKIEKQSTQMARQLTVSPTDTTSKVIVDEITKKENAIDNLRSALSSIDPNTPEGQELSTAIKKAETELSTLKKQSGETVETEQARLAREIAAPAVTPAPVSETITPAEEAAPVTTPAPAEVVTPAPATPTISQGSLTTGKTGALLEPPAMATDAGSRSAPASQIYQGEEAIDKAVEGTPHIAIGYHGGKKEIDVVDPTKFSGRSGEGWLGIGFYSAPAEDTAASYGPKVTKVKITLNNPFVFPENTNPIKYVNEQGGPAKFTEKLKEQGYDGVISKNVLRQIVAFYPESVSTKLETTTPAAPAAEPAGIAIGNRVKTKTTPQSFVVEEVLPQSEREAELGEQYYRIKNERTGEMQTVEANDIKPIKISTATKKMAPVRVEEKAQPVPEADRYTFDEAGIRSIEFFGGKAPDGLLIVNDTTNPNYEMKAGYDPETGDIILNRAYIKKGESIEDILTHELGHYIFSDPKFQADFKNFLESMPDDTRAEIEAIINQSYNKDTNQTQIEERQVMAFTALVKANKDTLSKWETIKNTIKRWINKIFGTNIKLSDEGAMAVFNVGFKRFKSGEKIIRAMEEGTLKMAAEPRKPAAEEQPTGPAPESPEGQSVPQAIANGIDIGPEDNMPINRKIDSHLKNFLFLRGFFESAVDRLRRNGFTKLGNAVADYFEGARRRLETANKILLPSFREYSSQRKKDREQIDKDVQEFFAAQENGRDTEEVRAKMNPVAIKIVDAWQKFGEVSGTENQNVGVKVYDQGKKAWRKIGRVEKFWPRQLKPEYQRALTDNVKYAKEYNEIVQALLDEKKIATPEEAEKYLRPYRPEAYENDYFSGIEKGRGAALPEKLYDYSMQVMTDYVSRWSQHVSRIEQFGQKTTQESKTLWDREMEKVTDQRTRDYIESVRERVVNYFPNDPYIKGMAAMNIWATGLQLGNPASAILNFIGGSTLNAMIGQPGSLGSFIKSLGEMTTDLKGQMLDAQLLAVTSRDLMNIVGDHQVIIDESKVAKAGQKVTDFLLKWSGFTPVEQMVRTQSYIIGKAFLNSVIDAYAKNPNSSYARRSSFWLTRNKFDLDKLLVEQGSGPETSRVLRYFANISQGSYTVDQVPVFIDNPIGKFLFKYQKFSTQVMRMAWKNTFEPLFKAMTGKGETMQLPDATRQALYRATLTLRRELGDERRIDISQIPTTVTKAQGRALALIPAMMWLGSAYVGGEVLLRLRDILFGVLMKGPEYEDMLKELEDDDKAAALYLASERAWYNLIGIGALGLIGNYAQFFFDWQDRERVKNPLDPPALGVLKETATFIQNLYDQKTITAGDIDNFTKSTLSAYRTTQKLGQTIAGWTGREDIPGVKEEMFRREVANINKYSRRWAEEAGIEFRMRRPTEVTPSERTPINRKIASYLQRGEPQMAAVFAKEYLKGLPKADRLNAIQSISTGARNRQPLRLGSGPMDEAERKAFLRWLKDKVSEERYARIVEMDKQYQRDYKKFLRMLPNR